MKKYKVKLGGENFLIHIEGKKRKIRFETEYELESEDQEKAEALCLESLYQELFDKVLNTESDPPYMFVVDVSELVNDNNDANDNSTKKIDSKEPKTRPFIWEEEDPKNDLKKVPDSKYKLKP